MSRPAIPFSLRGGARVGYISYSWPLAGLKCDSESLTLTVTLWGLYEAGRYRFEPGQVRGIERFGGLLGQGIRIRHHVTGYPEALLFYCRADAALRGIAESGFPLSAETTPGAPVPLPAPSTEPSRGFPLRIAPLLAALVAVNCLTLREWRGWSGGAAIPGPYLFAGMALQFALCLAALYSSRVQKILLRPGRSFEDVRPAAVFLTLMSGLGFLAVSALFLARTFR